MKVISLPRGQGKTTQLIKMSAETGIPIVTALNKEYIIHKANEMGLSIPTPIKFSFGIDLREYKEIYIDELDKFLSTVLGISAMAVTVTEDKDKNKVYDYKTQTMRNIETGKIITDNPQNAILSTLSKSLNSLLKKYDKMIDSGDSGGALNVLKNIEMVIAVIRDITDNQTLSKVLNNLSECWNDLDNQDDVSKAFMGEKEFQQNIKTYGEFLATELICAKNNWYYSNDIVESLLKTNTLTLSKYKANLNLKQYENKTYTDTIFETNNKEIN